jgi:hypothetical protein
MTYALEKRRAEGHKVETGAYMIRAESDPRQPWYSWSKQRYVAEVVLGKLWEGRGSIQATLPLLTMKGVWSLLQGFTGWGPFMAYQVCVDMMHTRYLRSAPDRETWAALGPGSRRGLNRLHGRPVKAALSQDDGLGEMLELKALVTPGMLAPWMDPIGLSDIQNCLCEFDKWSRIMSNEGRPRAKYKAWSGW